MKKHYDHAVYWHLPNDGAKFRCAYCQGLFSHTQVILTQIPKDDSRLVLCMKCVDDDWLENAQDLGEYGE